jgi:hypothetical protein
MVLNSTVWKSGAAQSAPSSPRATGDVAHTAGRITNGKIRARYEERVPECERDMQSSGCRDNTDTAQKLSTINNAPLKSVTELTAPAAGLISHFPGLP